MKPLVSILMSVKDGNLLDLKFSVESILNQTLKDYEFLIMDDGSTDRSIISYLRSLPERDVRIKLFRQENKGITKSLNTLLNISNTTFCARMDADDIALPKRLELQVSYLQAKPNIGVLGTWYLYINEKGLPVFVGKPPEESSRIKRELLRTNIFLHSSVMFSSEVIKSCGGYNELCKSSQDYELWLRLADKTEFGIIPEILQVYRLSKMAKGNLNANEQAEIHWVIQRAQREKTVGKPNNLEQAFREFNLAKNDISTCIHEVTKRKLLSRSILAREFRNSVKICFDLLFEQPRKVKSWIILMVFPLYYFIRGPFWILKALKAAKQINYISYVADLKKATGK